MLLVCCLKAMLDNNFVTVTLMIAWTFLLTKHVFCYKRAVIFNF